MRTTGSTDLTALLRAWSAGEAQAADALMAVVHKELRRQATRYLSSERTDHTFRPTALVNEAYLRLARQRNSTCARWHARPVYDRSGDPALAWLSEGCRLPAWPPAPAIAREHARSTAGSVSCGAVRTSVCGSDVGPAKAGPIPWLPPLGGRSGMADLPAKAGSHDFQERCDGA